MKLKYNVGKNYSNSFLSRVSLKFGASTDSFDSKNFMSIINHAENHLILSNFIWII